ncbi:MAG: hypothetical protein RAO92_04095 [Candidatus Euphemobacter frigidus]|nr:hypothetical protein [Candidatus Euphemobacter frigidus]MDP8275566.1 hypothetical protein [Candidatus Euphemobacter frigidus]
MNQRSNITKNSENGLALVALIAIMLIIGIVAYTFVNIISTQLISQEAPFNSIKSFYITEGALEIGKKYISDQNGTRPAGWPPDTVIPLYDDEPMGDGTFDLSINWPATGSITLNATANVD